ncbi:MAG: hypothetical protein QOH57_4452 [Mycobacterium sp.]|jgi:hypothetical protein|nr:hypothetical protein [Mycobacterium sp.]
MTIIELNIAGLHVTRSAPSRAEVKQSWQRRRAFGRNGRWAGWSATHLRSRQPADRRAA